MKNFVVLLLAFGVLASYEAHACTTQAFVSDSILNGQTQVSPGGTFTAHCNYGVASSSVTVSFTGGSCVLAGWIGTNGHFLCTAGSAPGNYTVSCNIGSPYCSQSNVISSMQVSGTISSPTPKPTPVVLVSHEVSISWSASTSSVVGYNVYRGSQSGGPYSKLNSSPLTSLSYADTSVLGGQTYFYMTTSVDSKNDESINSNQVSASVPAP